VFEVDQPPPSSAEVKNEWTCTSTPPIRLQSVHRNKFALFTPILRVKAAPSQLHILQLYSGLAFSSSDARILAYLAIAGQMLLL
jgi:hypothetical protein